MIYGYIKSIENCHSERDISMQKQLEILKTQGISTVYKDVFSKKSTNKENLYNLINILEQNDIVVATKLSRVADSLIELYDLCSHFSEKGFILKVLELGEITLKNNSIPSEKWLNALREFDKDINYEKICKGHLISSKNHQSNSAIPCGRPVKYSKKQLSEALKLRDRYTIREIVSITGISRNTLLRASNKMQL